MKLNRVALVVAGILPLLAGCSLAPTYNEPKTEVPATYKESGVWQPASPSDQIGRGDWWKDYNDATIDNLIPKLDAANPTLAEAVGHYDQAHALEQQASSSLFPVLNAGAFDTANQQFYNKPHIETPNPAITSPQSYQERYIGVGASYEVDFWGRVRNEVAAGKANEAAAAADLESVRLSLRATLVNDYLSLRGLDLQIKLLSDVVVMYQKALDLTEYRFHGGIDSELSVSRAKAQLDFARGELADFVAARALYEHAIASLVGQPASSFSLPSVLVELQVPNIPVGVPSALLQRRPDIAAAERRVAAANAQIGVARAAFFPTIDLVGGIGQDAILANQFNLAPTTLWTIGPTAFLTIFDAGRRQAIEDQAKATFNVAGAQYRQTVLRAFQEVEDNLTLLNQLAAESVSIDAAKGDTQRALEIAMSRYREGMENYLEVVTAQQPALQAELQSIRLHTRRLQASVSLIRALGGGYQRPKSS